MADLDEIPSSKVHSSKQLHTSETGLNDCVFDVHPEWVTEPPTRLESSYRHEHWTGQRQLVWDSFRRIGVRGNAMQAFAHCGSACWVQHSSSRGAFRLSCNTCKSRWCLPCQQARAARLRRSVAAQLEHWSKVRFITLTLRHSATPLKDQLDRLWSSYKELRRREIWTTSIEGAAAFFEVKIGKNTGLWHVHLHIIAVGGWIEQKALSKEWHKITGDSFIVDVSLARSKQGVTSYVVAYASKSLDSTVFGTPERLDEAIIALRGRRMCNGSGSLRSMSDKAVADGVDDWHTIARIDSLLNDARRGDEAALQILKSVSKRDRVFDIDFSEDRRPPPDQLII